ncbi:hypothetical protein HYC85_003345 [Camellia sinensis]|uniref:Uncharacterized protein n=1 Tax=Camellia sinensis TaxID=4442 RepID=A0A7J7IC79_CAMSI|nr:hypothetical protein HYC85_003345 [Camellia sinensis]
MTHKRISQCGKPASRPRPKSLTRHLDGRAQRCLNARSHNTLFHLERETYTIESC